MTQSLTHFPEDANQLVLHSLQMEKTSIAFTYPHSLKVSEIIEETCHSVLYENSDCCPDN